MTTETRNPTGNSGTWSYGYKAYTSDNQRAYTIANALHEYSGYGFNVESGATIDEVLLRCEGYKTDVLGEHVYVKVWNGSSWSPEQEVAWSSSESIINKDFSSFINTPAKLNSVKAQIRRYTAGGCFHPKSMFVTYKNEKFGLKLVSQIEIGDVLLGFDGEKFTPSKVTVATKHSGLWNMVRAYVVYPETYVNATCEHSKLKELMDLVPDTQVLSDMCMTDDHPVFVRARRDKEGVYQLLGEIPAGELQVSDLIGELYWDKQLACGGLPIDRIERFPFKGDVYDVRTESRWMFGKFLLGHFSKT